MKARSIVNRNRDYLVEKRPDGHACRDLPQLAKLKDAAKDAAFREEWAAVKLKAKKKAAAFLKTRCGIDVQPTAMFDIQARIVRAPAML